MTTRFKEAQFLDIVSFDPDSNVQIVGSNGWVGIGTLFQF